MWTATKDTKFKNYTKTNNRCFWHIGSTTGTQAVPASYADFSFNSNNNLYAECIENREFSIFIDLNNGSDIVTKKVREYQSTGISFSSKPTKTTKINYNMGDTGLAAPAKSYNTATYTLYGFENERGEIFINDSMQFVANIPNYTDNSGKIIIDKNINATAYWHANTMYPYIEKRGYECYWERNEVGGERFIPGEEYIEDNIENGDTFYAVCEKN